MFRDQDGDDFINICKRKATVSSMDWGIVIQIFLAIGASVSVYVAIRVDLAVMHEKIAAAHERQKSTEVRIENVAGEVSKAHDRIDGWYRSEPRK